MIAVPFSGYRCKIRWSFWNDINVTKGWFRFDAKMGKTSVLRIHYGNDQKLNFLKKNVESYVADLKKNMI